MKYLSAGGQQSVPAFVRLCLCVFACVCVCVRPYSCVTIAIKMTHLSVAFCQDDASFSRWSAICSCVCTSVCVCVCVCVCLVPMPLPLRRGLVLAHMQKIFQVFLRIRKTTNFYYPLGAYTNCACSFHIK